MDTQSIIAELEAERLDRAISALCDGDAKRGWPSSERACATYRQQPETRIGRIGTEEMGKGGWEE